MNYWLDIRLKIARFFRKHKKKIIIGVLIWVSIVAINYYLKYRPKQIKLQTTFEPHSPVMDNTEKVPEKYKEPINNLINNFIEYCNNRQYDEAYEILSDEYKNRYFESKDQFKRYINEIFELDQNEDDEKGNKIYNIQNYSNINKTYVYRVRILNDILADGTTEGYSYIEPKFVVKEENGTLKLSLDGYCGSKDLNIDVEDEYMNIKIKKKYMTYDNSYYEVEIKNKTENYIVLSDISTSSTAIQLKMQNDTRTAKYISNLNIVVYPNLTYKGEFIFDEYFDDEQDPTNLLLNSVRVLSEYNRGQEITEEDEKAIKLYSLSIDLIPQERK